MMNHIPSHPPELIIEHHQMEDDVNHDDLVQQFAAESGFLLDDRSKAAVISIQKKWLDSFQNSREKLLVEMTEKLHQEFLSDQQKIRTDLLTQFKDELDTTRLELDAKYKETLRAEVQRVQERHKREISSAKKKQWCFQCENEAIYHCCWNTAYCSVECQQGHWAQHRKFCRRKKGGAGGLQQPGPSNGHP